MNVLNQLTIKHLMLNKKRTIVTIIGVILSCALMVGIGTLASTFRDYSIQTVKANSGDQHATIYQVPSKNLNYISNNVEVEKFYYHSSLGYAKLENGKNDYKPYFYIEASNEDYLKTSKIVKGRLPQNANEIVIPRHLFDNGGVSYEIGETLTLQLGKRYVGTCDTKEELTQRDTFTEGEYLETEIEKTYTIVGIMERRQDENYSSPGYTALTLDSEAILKNEFVDVSLVYQKVNKIHDKTEKIAESVGAKKSIIDDETKEAKPLIDYNNSLLSLYGEGEYDSINTTMSLLIAIVLTLVSGGCAFVIYNSFAISVLERKKQFGLMASIGSTKKQLRKTVLFEALIVGSIGIPIGVFGGIVGIDIVLLIINQLLSGVFVYKLQLALYPLFIIIPIIYMIVTILVSAFLPARKAAKVSPIQAIHLNDDIKISSKKVKGGKWVRKCFGVEGELAYKNMKRNKRKYRITILSLIVSIVLFIGFSTFVEGGKRSSEGIFNLADYDISVSLYGNGEYNPEELQAKVESVSGIDQVAQLITATPPGTAVRIKRADMNYSAEFKKYLSSKSDEEIESLPFIALDKKSYDAYLKSIHLTPNENIEKELYFIYPTDYRYVDYNVQKYYDFSLSLHQGRKQLPFSFLTQDGPAAYDEEKDKNNTPYVTTEKTVPVYFVKESPALLSSGASMIISEEQLPLLQELFLKSDYQHPQESHTYQFYIKAKDHVKVAKALEEILPLGTHIDNYAENVSIQKNIVVVVGLLLYGFIGLVTLIGVTSVFNTISTSIALRRKEFAMLRSLGLSPKGFSKMIRYESLLYGLKALLYGLPLSFVAICFFNMAFNNLGTSTLLIPWMAIIICIIAVFVITFSTMVYATSKMKKENILDAIREENI